jgi:hypothetical protein
MPDSTDVSWLTALDWVGIAIFSVTGALALHFHWSLPVYRARAGRTVEEVEKMRK